jgi:hypothetical protein
MNLILISTIEQPNIWLKKDSINFTIGLMNEHGIHLAESLVVSSVDKIIYNDFFFNYLANYRNHLPWFNVDICCFVSCDELFAHLN